MPNIEERLQTLEQEHKTLEQEHSQLKKTIELQTIAIGALVNKATLERLNEKYDKLFDVLMAHDRLTNEQLAELRSQQIEEDGKIVGLQTEMRQRFNEQDSKFAEIHTTIATIEDKMATKDDITSIRQEIATKDDITSIRQEIATKDDITSIRQEIAAMNENTLDKFKQLITSFNAQRPPSQ